jgi:hypothetical protein
MNILEGDTPCKPMNIRILCPRYPQGEGYLGRESRKAENKYNSRSLRDDNKKCKGKNKSEGGGSARQG